MQLPKLFNKCFRYRYGFDFISLRKVPFSDKEFTNARRNLSSIVLLPGHYMGNSKIVLHKRK